MYKKSILLIITALLAGSGASLTLSAQDYIVPEIEISKEKVKIDGKLFLSHVVKEKQTLYSISKAYGTTVDALYRYNKGLREEGLKKNSILLIPVAEMKVAGQEEKQAVPATVKAVPENNTTAADSKENIRKEEKRKAAEPAKERRKKSHRKADKDQVIHVVKWYEDLKAIATKYNVSAAAIMEANKMNSTKLTTRQKLIIPKEGTGLDEDGNPLISTAAYIEQLAATPTSGKEKNTEEMTSGTQTASTAAAENKVTAERKQRLKSLFFFPKSKVKLSLFLPLQAKDGKASRNFMDFYSGALLAVKDLQQEGLNTDIKIFDTSNENLIALDQKIKESDLIIGPCNAEQISTLYTINKKTPVISPLDPRTEKLVMEHPNLIFAPTSHQRQYEDLCQWISEDYIPENRVIVIFEKDGYKTNHHPIVLNNLQSRGVKYTEFSYNILEGREIHQKLQTLMTSSSTNRIVIASESEAFVNDVVRNVNLLTLKNMDIILYASGKIRSFETIEPEYLHNTKLHTSMSYNIDYRSAAVMDFLSQYRALYNSEPSQFAFQGYDVTKYFVDMYSKYGAFWLDCITGETVPMLQSSFKFKREGEGYVNCATRRVVYDKDFVIHDSNEASIENL